VSLDIVVSKPTGSFGGVVQYDYGKTVEEGRFVRTGSLNKPPIALLTAVAKLEAEHMMAPSKVSDYLSAMTARYPAMTPKFTYRGKDIDRLFNAKYDHAGSNATCENCDKTKLVDRPVRSQTDPAIHYGVIASGNQVIRHGLTRDRLGKEHENLLLKRKQLA
jgi:hypothetical protein